MLTPRFAISTTDKLLQDIRDLAVSDPSLTIQTHISENPSEVKYTKELFSHLSTPEKPITYAGVYDHYHLLRDNTILAHAVHLEEEELKLVKERGSGISHCPTSNFNLTSGVAKVGALLDKEIKVGPPACLVKPLSSLLLFTGRPRDRRLWRVLPFDPHGRSTRIDRGQGCGSRIAYSITRPGLICV